MSGDELAKVPYDYVSVVPPGSTLFTSGACPLDAQGHVVGPGDYRTQADRTIENLLAVLATHGAGVEHLVKTTIYVVGDRRSLAEVWEAIAASLAPYRPPSTLLGVSTLGYPDQLVEVEGIAAMPP